MCALSSLSLLHPSPPSFPPFLLYFPREKKKQVGHLARDVRLTNPHENGSSIPVGGGVGGGAASGDVRVERGGAIWIRHPTSLLPDQHQPTGGEGVGGAQAIASAQASPTW